MSNLRGMIIDNSCVDLIYISHRYRGFDEKGTHSYLCP